MIGLNALLVIAAVVNASAACAGDDPLSLAGGSVRSTAELLPSFDRPLEPAAAASVAEMEGVSGKVVDRRIGLRPLFIVAPSEESPQGGDSRLPMVALVARARGRTLVTLTGTRPRIGPSDDVVFQRSLVSDLFQGRRFSLSVYEDHVMAERALRFLGLGTRLRARPSHRLFGCKLRFDLFGSYHPSHGGTGYLAISTSFEAPAPTVPMPALGRGE